MQTALIPDRRHSGAADTDAHGADAPRAPVAVDDQHGGFNAGQLPQPAADLCSAGVSVDRQQTERIPMRGGTLWAWFHIAAIHAGVGANPAAFLFHHQQPACSRG